MKKSTKTYKKLHHWPGFIISFLLLYFSLTGIVMNHRLLFSCFDVKRKNLPTEFRYANWNNSALKGNLNIHPDSILLFGSLGVYATDSSYSRFNPLNKGFGKASGIHTQPKQFDLPVENRTIVVYKKGKKDGVNRDTIFMPFKNETYTGFKLKAPLLCSLSKELSALVMCRVG